MASDVLPCSIDGLLDATTTRDALRVEFLMQSGVDPCSPTNDGTSPIHKAALLEAPAGPCIVSTMLSYGANPNVRTLTGLSPLHIASMWGRVETIDVLLDNGADVTLKDHEDRSALDYAEHAEERRIECIDALTRYRENKDGTDSGCEIAGCFYESTGNRTPQRQHRATTNVNNNSLQHHQNTYNYNNNYNSYYMPMPQPEQPQYYYDADNYKGDNWHPTTGYYNTGYTGGNWNYYLGTYPGTYDWNKDPYRSDNYYCGTNNTSEQCGYKEINNNENHNNNNSNNNGNNNNIHNNDDNNNINNNNNNINDTAANKGHDCNEETVQGTKTNSKIYGYDSEKKNYYWHNPLDESSRNNSLTRPPRKKNRDPSEKTKKVGNSNPINSNITTTNNLSIISAIAPTTQNISKGEYRSQYYRNSYHRSNNNNKNKNNKNNNYYYDNNNNRIDLNNNNISNNNDTTTKDCTHCDFSGSISCYCTKISSSSSRLKSKKKRHLNSMIVVSDDSDSFASPKLGIPRLRKASETISDISDISSTTSDSDQDDFHECEGGVVESSTDESFWSVSSVPNVEHNTTIDTLIQKLDQELTIQEEQSSCSRTFLGDSADSTVVIACGLQEKYRSKINHFHILCDFSQKLLSALALLDLPVVLTEDLHFYGPVVKELHSCHADVISTTNFSGVDTHLTEYLRNLPLTTSSNNTVKTKKQDDGAVADIHDIHDVDDDCDQPEKREVTDVVLFGLEAHTCVQLTALDLLSQGYNVHVVADATFSRNHDDRMFAFYRIRQSGGVVNTFESIMHSLLKDQNHPKYIPIKNLFSDNLFAVD